MPDRDAAQGHCKQGAPDPGKTIRCALSFTDADSERYALRSLDALLAENARFRETLEAFANPQHWGVTRDNGEPVPTWIGTYRQSPVELAAAALAAAEDAL